VYLTLKAFHIIAVIAWMAGMLYLPRLFVYHAGAKPGSEQSETFKVMELRLYKFIMTPAMIVTWVLGVVLVLQTRGFAAGWLQAKFALVIAMTIMHGLFGYWAHEFSLERNRHTPKFFRIVNEIPTVLLIGIVLLAVLKPF
jgi:putative membrane protein